ncbi:MAG: hypothetical protein ACOCTI_03320 [Phycisphaeraceae bacterium]
MTRLTLLLVPITAAATLVAGCQAPMKTPRQHLAEGEYARPRIALHEQLAEKPGDKRYLLDRLRLGVLTLADGYAESAALVFDEVYRTLRTQGLNRDLEAAATLLNEDVKIWKGEPFEQALALSYYALVHAELGSWDNARAAASNALLYLRDLEQQAAERGSSARDVARRSRIYERAIAEGKSPDQARRIARGETGDPDRGYVVGPSHYALGHLLHGVASRQLGRADEAADHFAQAVKIDPTLRKLAAELATGDYNTLLAVSWGLGPEKIGRGEDRAEVAFVPRFRSSEAPLRVSMDERPVGGYPQVLDVNAMAKRYLWDQLAGVRRGKSAVGSGLMTGGAVATGVGAHNDSDAAAYAGLGALAAGAFLKAGAHVDVRYADVFPQRMYLVPLTLDPVPRPITLQIEDMPSSRLVLTGLAAPRDGGVQLRYVRLVSQASPSASPPSWASSGRIYYGNPATGPAEARPLPYLLGGRDVRPPTSEVLDHYQRTGHLRHLTLAELRAVYRQEDVVWTREDQAGYAGAHLLEGGRSLVAPLGGTTGFVRLFGQLRPPYRARTDAVDAVRQDAVELAPPPLD